MGRVRFSRSPRARLAQLVVAGVVASAGVLAFGAGSAFANGSYACTGVAAIDTPGLQGDINTGGTVTVFGPKPCVGNWTVPVSVTIVGGSPGATLNGNATGSVLTTAATVTLTVRNLKITNGAAADGAGVFDNFCGSVVNLQNALVTGNTASDFGGGVYEPCGTLNATASTISNNSAGDEGGGIYVDGCGASINVTNSTVSSNTAAFDGGGMMVFCSDVTLTGATVTLNTSTGSAGGGMELAEGSTLDSTASTVSRNQALGGNGGGIYLDFSDGLLTNTKVSANTASDHGGGIENIGSLESLLRPQTRAAAAATSLDGGRAAVRAPRGASAVGKASPLVVPPGLTLVSSSVDHNTVTGFACGDSPVCDGAGGGIRSYTDCDGTASTTLTNSSVSFNRALGTEFDTDSGGGGVSQYAGSCSDDLATLTATGSSLIGNLARPSVGGGIFNVSFDGTALVTLASTSVASGPPYLNPNQAEFGGGIFNWDTNSNVTLQSGGNVLHNLATVDGGGVFNDCDATLNINPGAFIALNMPDQVVDNLGPCLLD